MPSQKESFCADQVTTTCGDTNVTDKYNTSFFSPISKYNRVNIAAKRTNGRVPATSIYKLKCLCTGVRGAP